MYGIVNTTPNKGGVKMTNTPFNELDFNIYVVVVRDEDGSFEYEYGTLEQAREHMKNEIHGSIVGYKDGKYYQIEHKI